MYSIVPRKYFPGGLWKISNWKFQQQVNHSIFHGMNFSDEKRETGRKRECKNFEKKQRSNGEKEITVTEKRIKNTLDHRVKLGYK